MTLSQNLKTGSASFEGKTIESITSHFELYQLINEPTHLLENFSSGIDLIFTSQPNLEVELGVHPHLFIITATIK